ncbi:MAG: hypothetical protein ACREAU_01685 [Nitrosopumilaceae archaeon]
MKLIEICLDKLNKTKLFEMAYERKKAIETVISLSPQIFEHLIKIFVFKLPHAKYHWIKEVNRWFTTIDRIILKPNNKRLTAEDIYEWMIFDSSPHYSVEFINSSVRRMLRMEFKDVAVSDYDANHLLNIILRIIQKVVKDIERDEYAGIEPYLPK